MLAQSADYSNLTIEEARALWHAAFDGGGRPDPALTSYLLANADYEIAPKREYEAADQRRHNRRARQRKNGGRWS